VFTATEVNYLLVTVVAEGPPILSSISLAVLNQFSLVQRPVQGR